MTAQLITRTRSTRSRRLIAGIAVLAAASVLAACSSSSSAAGPNTAGATSGANSVGPAGSAGAVSSATGSTSGGASAAVASTGPTSAGPSAAAPSSGPGGTLRLGYFANVTHAPAVLGVADGTFARDLGNTKLATSIFNAGPAAIEALNAGAIDAAFLGPSPAINAFVKSKGASLRIVAGAVENGAQLVVKPDIASVADLKGKKIATPQLGGTQDVALRNYLFEHGLKVQTNGGNDVNVISQDNSQTLTLFQSGQIDGGWLPEPWASRLVLTAGAKVLVNEPTLWPGGQFPTTILIVGKAYLDAHPDVVKNLIKGELDAIAEIKSNPTKSSSEINAAIGKLTGKPLSDAVEARAFANIVVSPDPLAATYSTESQHAVNAGLLKTAPNLDGIFDLRILNSLLKADGKAAVSVDGLGQA